MQPLTCFKAYDIRGRLGEELDEALARKIGQAFAAYIKPQVVVIGGDVRSSSESLKHALAEGLMDSGVNVIDLGVTGTEEIYFATRFLKTGGGIQVTASHNPIDFNGMKLVREDSKPVGQETGLLEIKRLVEANCFTAADKKGSLKQMNLLADYVKHLMSFIEPGSLMPLKLVVNSGNGPAGKVIDAIESHFKECAAPVSFVKVHHRPDSTFPNGIPNPLLPENRFSTRDAVLAHKANLGIAFDGDFDRCFFFDETGAFIEGYYIVGLLADYFLTKEPGAKIVHDVRLTWNTIEKVTGLGGHPVLSRAGHAFIKECMRTENAVYGGEMSAHHYFRDFGYCDSGMLPWLIIIQLMSRKKCSLSSLTGKSKEQFPVSGEINRRLQHPEKAIRQVVDYYVRSDSVVDHTDGISIEFDNWRFNLRQSNTEPVVRLNVESRADEALVRLKMREIIEILEQ